jgi:hypothetical protein
MRKIPSFIGILIIGICDGCSKTNDEKTSVDIQCTEIHKESSSEKSEEHFWEKFFKTI